MSLLEDLDMIPIRKLMLMAIASLLWAGVSSATPIGVALSLDWVGRRRPDHSGNPGIRS